MTTGTITWFSARQGIGFVVSDGGRDLCVRAQPCDPNHPCALKSGLRIRFTEQESPDGPEAVDISVEGTEPGRLGAAI